MTCFVESIQFFSNATQQRTRLWDKLEWTVLVFHHLCRCLSSLLLNFNVVDLCWRHHLSIFQSRLQPLFASSFPWCTIFELIWCSWQHNGCYLCWRNVNFLTFFSGAPYVLNLWWSINAENAFLPFGALILSWTLKIFISFSPYMILFTLLRSTCCSIFLVYLGILLSK